MVSVCPGRVHSTHTPPPPRPPPSSLSGELYPCETETRLCDELTTGDEVEVNLETDTLTVVATGKTYPLKPLGDAGPVVDAGGIFEYARAQGMIKKA